MTLFRLTAAAALAGFMALSACQPASQQVMTTDTGIVVTILNPADAAETRFRILDTVNALRAERGLQDLTLSPELTAAARTHARDMAVQGRAWHFGSDRSSPLQRAQVAGYLGPVTGENVAETFETDVPMLQAWLDNPATRRVMLDPEARTMGMGWFQEKIGKIWWVQVFGG